MEKHNKCLPGLRDYCHSGVFFLLMCVVLGVAIINVGPCASGQDIEISRTIKPVRPSSVFSMAFSPDGKVLAFTDGSGGAQLWDLPNDKEGVSLTRKKLSGRVFCMSFSPDGNTLALGYIGQIGLWDMKAGTEKGQFVTEKSFLPSSLSFSTDGKTLMALSRSKGVKLFQMSTGKLQSAVPLSSSVCKMASFLPDSNDLFLLVGSELDLWHSNTGKLEAIISESHGPLECAALAPDAKLIAAAGFTTGVWLWEIKPRKVRVRFDGRRDARITSIAFSPDSRTLATATDGDHKIHLWEVSTRKVRASLDKQNVLALAFSPSGHVLAVGCRDGSINLWDLSKINSKTPEATDLVNLWDALGNEDALLAYRAIRTLSASPVRSLPLLGEQLRPFLVSADELKKTNGLLAGLNSEDFATREKASDELARIGLRAGAALSRALAEKPSLEFRRRASDLLERIERQKSGNSIQVLRAVEVLEHIGTPEARALLAKVAEDAAEAYLWREAKASLARLAKRPAPKP